MFINKERVINAFVQLAEIASPSGKEEKVAEVLIKKLGNLGLKTQRDSYGNIVAKLPGIGEPIVLCAHMDTVAVGKNSINVVVDEVNDIIRSDGTTILGGDNKDSIAAILEMLLVVKENSIAHRPIEIILTREEESISKGAENLDLSLISGKECYISDQADPYGTITMSAPFLYAFNVEIRGKTCHVKEPEKGINAIRIMARAIDKPEMPLGRIDKLTTVNIGSIVAGLSSFVDDAATTTLGLRKFGRNSVPDLARVYGEVRGADESIVLRLLDDIKGTFNSVCTAEAGMLTFDVEKRAGGYLHSTNDRLVARVAAIFLEQKSLVSYFNAVGGSDANILEQRGLHTVVFSSAHRNNHQVSEYVIVSDLIKLTDFYVRLVSEN